MEMQEFMREFDRMCWYYKRKQECPMGCPMNGVNISQCRKIAFERPSIAEKTIKDWANEHPVPPTLREWLDSQGIKVRADGSICFDNLEDADKRVPEIFIKSMKED